MRRIEGTLGLVLLLSGGCSSLPTPADVVDRPSPGNYIGLASHNKLVDHPSPAVSAPAALGTGIGTLLGIPIMIVALPITVPLGISAWSDDARTSNLQVVGNAIAFPDAVCAVGGAYAFGSVPYAIVGPSGASPTASRGGPVRPALATPPPPTAPVDKLDPSLPPPPRFSADELGPN